ncbi:MAG: FTR1 family protein [Gammaproteobacteria bacterium]|nr:FTR1 family protein [Gammaproteobacteria bacterium]MDE1886613.1 FTR1 family protein [Gammaproteobacteria bacterium]MDE2023198.1 FTR1 family protein [Gammaproteobacteria bacterium]MDE2273244.1 FTR1 family protein [Gammaproteobacteria bacterium]
MLATAVIVFREVLEAALVIAIVLGASRSVAGRGWWVLGGIVLGTLGAGLVALFADAIAQAFTGNGQSLLNAVILLLAVLMLGWHIVWMSGHGRKLAGEIKEVGAAVQAGKKTLAALLVICFTAVMREGSEVVLFLWAIAASGGREFGMTVGGFAGLAAGIAVGALLYRSLLFIPIRYFFTVTGWLLLLLTAGLAAQAAGFLNQANLLPALGTSLWNTSHILSQQSMFGELLHILVGYIARPSGIELLFYAVTLVTIFTLMRLMGRHAARPRTTVRGSEARAEAQPSSS